MEESLKLYWQAHKKLSTEKIIRQSSNPLREYEDDFIGGAIIDIGCGQSNFLLDYANSHRKLYAVDNEQSQLDSLKERAEEIDSDLKNWNFINLNFLNEQLPSDTYAVIILSNLLHFFTLQECKTIVPSIDKISQKGTLIYIVVHSYTHYANRTGEPDNHDYFKHYFKIEDLNILFGPSKYETVYTALVERRSSKSETDIINAWLDKMFEKEGITDTRSKQTLRRDYLKSNRESYIQMILRKK